MSEAPPPKAGPPEESLDDQILRLDKRWEREQEQYLISGARATVFTSLITLVVGSGAGLAMIILSCMGKFPYGAMIGPVALFGGIMFGTLGIQKAKQYTAAEKVYEQRRDELERQQQLDSDSPDKVGSNA